MASPTLSRRPAPAMSRPPPPSKEPQPANPDEKRENLLPKENPKATLPAIRPPKTTADSALPLPENK